MKLLQVSLLNIRNIWPTFCIKPTLFVSLVPLRRCPNSCTCVSVVYTMPAGCARLLSAIDTGYVSLLQVAEVCSWTKYKWATDSEIQLGKHLKLSEINSTAYIASFSEVTCSKSIRQRQHAAVMVMKTLGCIGRSRASRSREVIILLCSVTVRLPLHTASNFGPPVQTLLISLNLAAEIRTGALALSRELSEWGSFMLKA